MKEEEATRSRSAHTENDGARVVDSASSGRYIGQQIVALLHKDLQILRAHRFRTFFQFVVPLALGALVGYLLDHVTDSSFLPPESDIRGAKLGSLRFAIDALVVMPNSSSVVMDHADAVFGAAGVGITPLGLENTAQFRDFLLKQMPEGTFACPKDTIGIAVPLAAAGSTASVTDADILIPPNLQTCMYTGAMVGSPQAAMLWNYGHLYSTSLAQMNFGQLDSEYEYGRQIAFSIGVSMSLVAILSLVPMVGAAAAAAVDEKRSKLREHLRVMGVRPVAYVLAFLLFSAVNCCLFAASVVVGHLVTASALKRKASSGLFFTEFGVLFLLALTMMGFARILPFFFVRPQLAQGVASLFLSVSLVGGIFGSAALPTGLQFAFCALLSPYAAITALAPAFVQGIATVDVPFSFAIAVLPLQVVCYSALGEYLYAIRPGDFGIPLHPLFPLHWFARRWNGGSGQSGIIQDVASDSPALGTAEAGTVRREAEVPFLGSVVGLSTQLPPGPPQANRVVLRQLVKFYGAQRDTPAVAGLTLDVRRGEILSLLGQNGAGKTTALAVLCGLTPATSYAEATVDGLDVATRIEDIRRRLGYCPQFDVIYDDLTGRQHLELYARIKGSADPVAAATAMLLRLDLSDDGKPTRAYSGGMKRRLSVGMALVGGAQLVVLDEPSSGLDPASRRGLWKLIREERDAGRTVLLTTHFMEEAEALGDRVAIMSYGKLYCCDTSSALKVKYGAGYFMTCEKIIDEEGERAGVAASFDPKRILSIIRGFVPEASLHAQASTSATFQLPIASVPMFSSMFAALEPQLPVLGCASLGLSANSLEDVFLRIADAEAEANAAADSVASQGGRASDGSTTQVPMANAVAGLSLGTLADGSAPVDHFSAAWHDQGLFRFLGQARAIWWRHTAATLRTPATVFQAIILPLVFIWIGAAAIFSSRYADDVRGKLSPFPKGMDPLAVPVCEAMGKSNASYFDSTVRTLAPAFHRAERLFADRNPGKSISFEVRDPHNCLLMDPKSIAFTADFHVPLALVIVNDARYDPRDGNLRFAWRQSNMYSAVLYAEAAIAFETGLLAQATGKGNQLPDPSVRVALQPNVWSKHASHTASGSPPVTMYVTSTLGILSLVAGALLAGSTTVAIADDVNRGTLAVLRAHGLGIGAYWAGTLAAALPGLLLLIGSYVAILLIRDVKPITNSAATLALFAGSYALCLVHLVLLGAVLVFVLPPNLKHSTYMSAVSFFLWGEILVPAAIFGIASAFRHTAPFQALLTPAASFASLQLILIWPKELIYSGFDIFGPDWRMVAISGSWTVGLLAILLGNGYVWWGIRPQSPGPQLAEAAHDVAPDEDVLAEESRVADALRSGQTTADAVTAHGLRRVFKSLFPAGCPLLGKRDVLAVKSATFGVRPGECFGVLGQNGAGKTTTIRMLLHDTNPTAGIATFRAADGSSKSAAQQALTQDGAFQSAAVGVCVQHDALIPTATADEHLDLFLRIRLGWSYCPALWREYKANALRSVRLVAPDGDVTSAIGGAAGNKQTQEYSGGMKRKLAACLALHCGASTSFLDEPSTGVDPHARRALWRTVKDALAPGAEAGAMSPVDPALAGSRSVAAVRRAVILTTHSMGEADAVCDRIAIFAEGTIRCIGSGQRLKRRFGSGYSVSFINCVSRTVDASVPNPGNVEPAEGNLDVIDGELVDAMRAAFPDCWLRESLPTERRFSIPTVPSLAVALRALENIQGRLPIGAFSISQVASLEDVFLSFTSRTRV